MVEPSRLEIKLHTVNQENCSTITLYLYGNPVYAIIYQIMGPYKNYLGWPKTAVYNKFNKIILKLKIEREYSFTIHQNL